MSSRSFARMATVAFTTKRPPALAGGKRGEPVAHLVDEDQRCTPLDPADAGSKAELVERQIVLATTLLKECYVDADLDIVAGDVLVVGGRDYPIKAVGRWEWRGSEFLALIVEDLLR